MDEQLKKEQHIVPETYLKHFVTNTKRNVFTSGSFIKSPKPKDAGAIIIQYNNADSPNVFCKKTFYYETKDKDGNIVENINMVENWFGKIENNYNETMKPILEITNNENKTIPNDTIEYCYKFFTMLLLRTHFYVELMQYMGMELVENHTDLIGDDKENAGLIIGKRFFTESIMQKDLWKSLKRYLNSITIYIAPENKCFYTNDNPVSIIPTLYGIKLIVPVSPRLALMFHKTLIRKTKIKNATEKMVNKINIDVIKSANEKFVATGETNPNNNELIKAAFKQRMIERNSLKNVHNNEFIAKVILLYITGNTKELKRILNSSNIHIAEKISIILYGIILIPYIFLIKRIRKHKHK